MSQHYGGCSPNPFGNEQATFNFIKPEEAADPFIAFRFRLFFGCQRALPGLGSQFHHAPACRLPENPI